MRINSPNQKKKNEELQNRLDKYAGSTREMEDGLCRDMGHLVSSMDIPNGKSFKIADHPSYKSAFGRLKDTFASSIVRHIDRGQSLEWKNSNVVQDTLAENVLKRYKIRKGDKYADACFLTNEDYLKAFQQRKVNGATISKIVWDDTDELMKELECAVTASLKDGRLNEIDLARRLQKYIHDHDLLQKDHKEVTGKWADCKNMDWRVMRLVRNEINMAYRLAQLIRWRQMPFVIGMTIKTSQDSHEKEDMCDMLQGDYPLWLEWYGWHVNCKCYAKPIIGEKKIEELPDNFGEWIANNKDRINDSLDKKTEHKFIRDNKDVVKEILDKPFILDKGNLDELKMRGFSFNISNDKKLIEEYNKGASKGWDILTFDRKVESIADKWKVRLNTKKVYFKDGEVVHSYYGKDEEGNRMVIMRTFIFKNGKREVKHDFFILPEKMQGIGIAKDIGRSMFRQYEKMGIDVVRLQANMEKGGAYWGKYGFKAKKTDALDIVLSAYGEGRITEEQYIIAKSVIDSTKDEYINMKHLVSLHPFGWDMLQGSSWEGHLNMKDEAQLHLLKKYLVMR